MNNLKLIPMGVFGMPFFKIQTTKLRIKIPYQGEIGSSDMDDPFTQEEKIGYNAYLGSSDMDDPFTQEEKIGYISKDKEPEKGKERQREDDSLEKIYREQQRQRDREEYERNQQDPSDWTDRDYGTYWGNQ